MLIKKKSVTTSITLKKHTQKTKQLANIEMNLLLELSDSILKHLSYQHFYRQLQIVFLKNEKKTNKDMVVKKINQVQIIEVKYRITGIKTFFP